MTADKLTHADTAQILRVSTQTVAKLVRLYKDDPMFLEDLAQRETEAKRAERDFHQVVVDLLEAKGHELSARVQEQTCPELESVAPTMKGASHSVVSKNGIYL